MTSETLTLGNSTVTTVAQQAPSSWIVSYFVNSTGTATGTWTVECSNDGATFTTYALTTSPPAATGSGQTFGVAVVGFEYAYVRLKFTGSGGSGSATVTTVKKAR